MVVRLNARLGGARGYHAPTPCTRPARGRCRLPPRCRRLCRGGPSRRRRWGRGGSSVVGACDARLTGGGRNASRGGGGSQARTGRERAAGCPQWGQSAHRTLGVQAGEREGQRAGGRAGGRERERGRAGGRRSRQAERKRWRGPLHAAPPSSPTRPGRSTVR